MPSNLRRALRSFVASPVKEEKTYSRIDEPGLALDLAARHERNGLHAKSKGLPAIGSRLLNPHGLEFVVEGHVHVPTANTIQTWRDGKGNAPTDLYHSIIPQNLSAKLMDFIETVDRCTTKTLLVLDTMPYTRKDSGVPGGHWIDTLGNTGANLLFVDAASIHETHFAHEIGHLWIQYVDQAEDERVLEDANDPARINQLSFIQSFVLDFRVNEIIEAHGFNMSVIREDQDQAIASLGRAIQAGYRPENKREEVFMALTLATHLVESRADKRLAIADDTLERVSQLDPEFLELANKFAEAVQEFGFRDKESIRASIDTCLSIAFEHTGDGIDLDHDLVIPPTQEPDFDKYPQWMEGASTDLKCEVGRLMAREAVPNECNWIMSPSPEQTCLVSFKLPEGEILGPWTVNHPYPTSPHSDRRREINEINRQNRERQMKQTQQATSPLDNMPGQPRRFYMAGTGRFLTRVREEEWLGGESAYGYALGNPVTYTDPSGLTPCSAEASMVVGWGKSQTKPKLSKLSLFRKCQQHLEWRNGAIGNAGLSLLCPGGKREICIACSEASGLPMNCGGAPLCDTRGRDIAIGGFGALPFTPWEDGGGMGEGSFFDYAGCRAACELTCSASSIGKKLCKTACINNCAHFARAGCAGLENYCNSLCAGGRKNLCEHCLAMWNRAGCPGRMVAPD